MKITEEEVLSWCQGTVGSFAVSRLVDILNKDYDLDEAIEDVLSFRQVENDKCPDCGHISLNPKSLNCTNCGDNDDE